MSVLAGIWERRRPQVDEHDLGRLLSALDRIPSDVVQEVVHGPLAMAIAVDAPFAEPHRRSQPLDGHGVRLVWDGRLDNRADLMRTLKRPRERISDGELVLALFQDHGEACFASLVGDFALALWDSASRRLILARDALGVRPLYYYQTPRRIIWASDIRLLLTLPGVHRDIDDEFIAGYLTREAEASRTPYQAIRAVPAAHLVVVSANELCVRRYWSLDPKREVTFARDAEYDEQFRTLLKDAVRARLQVDGPVCSELSGGLDSSGIVRIADGLMAQGEATASQLWTASFVYDQAPSADEREFIREVEVARNAKGVHISGILLDRLSFDDGIDFPSQARCYAALFEQLGRTLETRRTRVLLSGLGGDQMTWGEVPALLDLADLLKLGRLAEFRKRLIAWSLDQQRPMSQLAWHAVRPLLPPRWRYRGDPNCEVPSWYAKTCIARMHLADRMRGPNEALSAAYRLPSQREQLAMIVDVTRGLSCGYMSCYPGVKRVHITYPYLHRPFVEFSLAVPMVRHVKPGEPRALMRRALRGVLPEKVRLRQRKNGPSEAMCNAVARQWPRLQELLRDARVCEYGYFEPKPFRDALDAMRHGRLRQTFFMSRALALEFWLRAQESHGEERSRAAVVTDSVSPQAISALG